MDWLGSEEPEHLLGPHFTYLGTWHNRILQDSPCHTASLKTTTSNI